MNTRVLKAAEKKFLMKYPGGFMHPEIVEIGKKHKMPQIEKFARESFAKSEFEDTDSILANMVKLVSRSSMISIFEKPKFRDMVQTLSPLERTMLVQALYDMIHGKKRAGFETLVDVLREHKQARWTLTTVFNGYYNPRKEILIKPTTTKLIIDKLELGLTYKPQPTWEFYRDYRKIILDLKTKVDETLSPSNPAFCGFLMMTLGE